MRQFDVVRLRRGELVVVLQNNLLDHFSTRVIVPLLPPAEVRPTPRLHPLVRIGRRNYVVATEQITTVRAAEVAAIVGSAKAIEHEIRRALDIIWTGV